MWVLKLCTNKKITSAAIFLNRIRDIETKYYNIRHNKFQLSIITHIYNNFHYHNVANLGSEGY